MTVGNEWCFCGEAQERGNWGMLAQFRPTETHCAIEHGANRLYVPVLVRLEGLQWTRCRD
jgi:hypothetical protein